jgi:hypothetical protein
MMWCTLLVLDHELLSEHTDGVIQKMCALIAHYHLWATKPYDDILKYEEHDHLCSAIFDWCSLWPSFQVIHGSNNILHTNYACERVDGTNEINFPFVESFKHCDQYK